jgi:transcriptional regulator with GAF, ATPase, and Fis domain
MRLTHQKAPHIQLPDRVDALVRVGINEADNGCSGEERDRIVGLDGGLQSVGEVLERVASTDSTVILRGESGTGKELIARQLHLRSRRAQQRFVRANCAAFAPGVLESELFGHEAGAFTGAAKARMGRFEQADGGTLFLDEIGELDMTLQVKLLRVLQEREFERVGGNRTIRTDIRLLAATHRNLEAMVKQGLFREDLYHRVNVVPLLIPPLRAHPQDIAALAQHFVSEFAAQMGKRLSISECAMDALRRYAWPGNIRELRNVIERAAVLAESDATIEGKDLTFDFTSEARPAPSIRILSETAASSVFAEIEQREIDQICEALRSANGCKTRAARLLGIPRTTLNARIRRLGIS